jgi:hypothetical protein
MEAAQNSGDGRAGACLQQHGRMVAAKNSPIWQFLGSAWDDSLGNPYPPFAFNSGMDWLEVERDEAVALGVVDSDQEIAAQELPDLNAELQSGYEFRTTALRESLVDTGLVKFLEGVLVPA